MRSNFIPVQCCGVFASLLLLAGCSTPNKSTSASETSFEPPAEKPIQRSLHTNIWTSNWTPLFDGKTLTNWAVTDFAGHGDVKVEPNQIKIFMGADLCGITWTNGTLPKTDYEVSLEANKLDGNDFFCGLTFQVGESHCSLILGGWGGAVVGLSSLDGMDASENETSKNLYFEKNRWFHVRVQVTREKILAWLDEDKIIDVGITDRKVSLRPGDIEHSIPLGVATYMTTAAVRNLKLRLLK